MVHPVYSFSKSLTAAAIGFAEQEGLLSLEERLVDIFPELVPENPSENLKQITLHHLLCMSCGHETEIRTDSPDWMERFMNHPVLHRPGTFFKYNTPGTHMLAAVLKRKTGQDVTEFLRPRLLEPLGITKLICSRLPGKEAVQAGGSGMKLTTEEMARFTEFLLRRGCWEGRQLLNRGWFDRAAVKQAETEGDSEGHVKDWAQGYGYQCWMSSVPGSFRADGAYGQFGLVYPSLDMVVAATMATEQTQSFMDAVTQTLLAGVKEEKQEPSLMASVLQETLKNLQITGLQGDRNPQMEEKLSGCEYTVEDAGRSLEELIGGAGLADVDRTSVMTGMQFAFEKDQVVWKICEGEQRKELAASLEGTFTERICGEHIFAGSAGWRSVHALEFDIRRLDAISGARLICRFEGEKLRIEREDTLVSTGDLGVSGYMTLTAHRSENKQNTDRRQER